VALDSSGNTIVAPNRRTELSSANLGGFGLEINTLMFFLLVESGIMPPSPQEFTACPSPRDSKDAKGRIFIGCYRPLTGCTVAVFWANQFVTLIKINVVGGNFCRIAGPRSNNCTQKWGVRKPLARLLAGREAALRARSDRSIFRALISMYGKAALPRLVSFGSDGKNRFRRNRQSFAKPPSPGNSLRTGKNAGSFSCWRRNEI
jgi:hypothetical protein